MGCCMGRPPTPQEAELSPSAEEQPPPPPPPPPDEKPQIPTKVLCLVMVAAAVAVVGECYWEAAMGAVDPDAKPLPGEDEEYEEYEEEEDEEREDDRILIAQQTAAMTGLGGGVAVEGPPHSEGVGEGDAEDERVQGDGDAEDKGVQEGKVEGEGVGGAGENGPGGEEFEGGGKGGKDGAVENPPPPPPPPVEGEQEALHAPVEEEPVPPPASDRTPVQPGEEGHHDEVTLDDVDALLTTPDPAPSVPPSALPTTPLQQGDTIVVTTPHTIGGVEVEAGTEGFVLSRVTDDSPVLVGLRRPGRVALFRVSLPASSLRCVKQAEPIAAKHSSEDGEPAKKEETSERPKAPYTAPLTPLVDAPRPGGGMMRVPESCLDKVTALFLQIQETKAALERADADEAADDEGYQVGRYRITSRYNPDSMLATLPPGYPYPNRARQVALLSDPPGTTRVIPSDYPARPVTEYDDPAIHYDHHTATYYTNRSAVRYHNERAEDRTAPHPEDDNYEPHHEYHRTASHYNTRTHHDERGAPQHYDERGAPQHYDERGAPQHYDEHGAPQHYDERGAPQHYDERDDTRHATHHVGTQSVQMGDERFSTGHDSEPLAANPYLHYNTVHRNYDRHSASVSQSSYDGPHDDYAIQPPRPHRTASLSTEGEGEGGGSAPLQHRDERHPPSTDASPPLSEPIRDLNGVRVVGGPIRTADRRPPSPRPAGSAKHETFADVQSPRLSPPRMPPQGGVTIGKGGFQFHPDTAFATTVTSPIQGLQEFDV